MILLEVPFAEKDTAKSLGARWNPLEKKWYVPDDLEQDLTPFERWLPSDSEAQAVISPLSDDATSANEKQKGIPLSHLMHQVQAALQQKFIGAVWVMAEVANLNERRGHWYFELTETAESGQQLASCRAMIWQSQAERILSKFSEQTGSELTPGQKILLLVEPTFHERFGFSLVIQDIDPSFTLGELEAKLQAIRKQLIDEKLYDKNKAYPMPKDFFRVAVISPPSAAGLGDFRADADLLVNQKLCEFKYFYSAFQGEQVETEMLGALDAFEALHHSNRFDALIIIRGGGAKLDLQPLNNYPLAKRIAELDLPVLTGIGHERDNTILDEVAAVRFDTPSKAIAAIQHAIFSSAQKAQQNWFMIEKASLLYVQKQKQTLRDWENQIHTKSYQLLQSQKQWLTPLILRIQQQSRTLVNTQQHRLIQTMDTISHQAKGQLQLQIQQLDRHFETVEQRPAQILASTKTAVKQLIAFILSSGPETQLNRGFSIIKNAQQKVITSREEAIREPVLEIQFKDGSLSARPVDNSEESS